MSIVYTHCRNCPESKLGGGGAVDGFCVDCLGLVIDWARERHLPVPYSTSAGGFEPDFGVNGWEDPRWVITAEAFLEAHPPQRNEEAT